jgi:phosphate/sulfate permease
MFGAMLCGLIICIGVIAIVSNTISWEGQAGKIILLLLIIPALISFMLAIGLGDRSLRSKIEAIREISNDENTDEK